MVFFKLKFILHVSIFKLRKNKEDITQALIAAWITNRPFCEYIWPLCLLFDMAFCVKQLTQAKTRQKINYYILHETLILKCNGIKNNI